MSATYRCSRCGRSGHNARTCQVNLTGPSAERMLRMSLPAWIAATRKRVEAEERRKALITPELMQAWADENEATQEANEVGLACDGFIRALPPERRDEVCAAIRDGGFEALAVVLS